ncbi:pyrroline-5-carboxylate reductase [Flavobacterium franklandianum]|uniref:Pyrroline-5-carboxylate reductase n=1 Tax=Flavobacterium franklandianum TaxID=2594430 RepID=A0A553CSZ2_9FLAO|nr:pyrroline-5-carboxylate reductase [Flavobacterium franklandianum]TRX23617.1 pyrroline-5-carboxylate reductase [Flavobacterium franklandianum]TRX29931.1 pyrroline-5-carboxylate reductase [Flavobacterium franklandianum]
MKVHIIGGGNLGVSIALGLTRFSKNNQITVTRRNTTSILYLEELGVTVSKDNKHNIQDVDVIILTIKPYQVNTVLAEILPLVTNKVIASGVSGLSIEALQNKIGDSNSAIRIMPNIAAQFGASATCIAFNERHATQAQNVVSLFQDLGTAPIIDEKLMDAATVLAASGTAFALRYIRASMQAGIEIGFDWKTALAISAQTVKGAAEMILEENIHPEQLIDRVTTPQGCTIAGLNEMEMHGFSSSLIRGIKTSLKQIKG